VLLPIVVPQMPPYSAPTRAKFEGPPTDLFLVGARRVPPPHGARRPPAAQPARPPAHPCAMGSKQETPGVRVHVRHQEVRVHVKGATYSPREGCPHTVHVEGVPHTVHVKGATYSPREGVPHTVHVKGASYSPREGCHIQSPKTGATEHHTGESRREPQSRNFYLLIPLRRQVLHVVLELGVVRLQGDHPVLQGLQLLGTRVQAAPRCVIWHQPCRPLHAAGLKCAGHSVPAEPPAVSDTPSAMRSSPPSPAGSPLSRTLAALQLEGGLAAGSAKQSPGKPTHGIGTMMLEALPV